MQPQLQGDHLPATGLIVFFTQPQLQVDHLPSTGLICWFHTPPRFKLTITSQLPMRHATSVARSPSTRNWVDLFFSHNPSCKSTIYPQLGLKHATSVAS